MQLVNPYKLCQPLATEVYSICALQHSSGDMAHTYTHTHTHTHLEHCFDHQKHVYDMIALATHGKSDVSSGNAYL